jgi:signal transduction histidine kinase
VACTLAPILGRRFPATSAVLAVVAVAAYQAMTDDPNGGFVVGATLLAFFYLGRDHPGTSSVRRLLGVMGLALPAVIGASVSSHDSAISGLGTWFVIIVVPTAVGRVAERRQRLVNRLEQVSEALRRDQLRAADAAAALERARVARELHDVVAHYVTVMVIQAGAARSVCTADPDAGRAALDAVETAGRRALYELRRVLGALRRGPDDWPDGAIGLAQFHELCESVRATGVRATLAVTHVGELTVDCAQAAYRVVQEALTNVVRHAPGAHATVVIRTCDEVEVEITDDGGRNRVGSRSLPPSGYGLAGMAERVAWVGGTVEVGPLPWGGFRVAATFPMRPQEAVPHDVVREARWTAAAAGADLVARHRDWQPLQRWLDPAAAAVFVVALGIDAGLRASGTARVPSIVLGVVLGVLVLWRRRNPMVYLLATLAVTAVLTLVSETVSADPLFGVFALVVPTYTVAAWLPQRRAALAFAIWASGAAVHASRGHSPAGHFVGALVAACVVFAVGRLTRAQRTLAAELNARNAELAAERDNRAGVAVINERIRIARDLHVLIARTITAMVVQAATARELVSADRAAAYTAAAEVERSGREVLTQMRRVLGVLRADRSVPLLPPAAVDLPAPASVVPA